MTKEVHLYASQRVSRRAKDGIDGTSVTIISKSVTYQISASGTETPTGNWSDKVVATTDTKPYLWTRTIVVYSDTNSTTSYSVSYKGKDGAPGKDAYRVEASPSTLVFDTNENGVVDGSALSGKYATVTVYKGSQKISVDNLSLPSNYATKKYTNVDGKISNNNGEARITITKIEQEAISGDEKVSKSSGQISFPIDVLGERSTLMWVTVNVQVNVAKFTGSVVANNKKFETKFTEISNRFEKTPTNDDLAKAESRITQTAREISLSVSEKVIGRRNLLIGSALLRDDSNRLINYAASIEINSGYQGTNCVKSIDDTKKGDHHYIGVFWDGSQGGKSIKITKGKKYVLSCYCKTNDINAIFCLEAIYTDKQTNAQRKGNPEYLTNRSFSCKSANRWELFTAVIDTTDAEYNYIAFNFYEYSNGDYGRIEAWICRPMVEEGDTYNGWTLSTEDYDYVGGNMLDNTLSLDKSGTLYDVNGTLTPAGFGESTSIYKSFAYKLKGTVDSFSQLPSSGNVYGDMYYVRNTEICYRYNGSEFESVGNDYYYNVLEWRKLESGVFVPFGLEANKDYVFSFMAKGTGKLTAYFYSPETNVFVESSLGETATRVDGAANFQLTSDWKKYWVHWRPSDSSHRYVLLRLNRTIQSSVGDAPITNCYIAQPKLEAGAVVTEYTERKSDLVDKVSLKAAGIEVTSEKVKLYGDQIEFAQTKSGTAFAMFKDGMLDARLINAAKIIAERLETSGNTGQRVAIEDGLMQIFGTNGVCNIKFGVNDNGEAILSYYDKNGKWLYDLGPNKLDGSQITSSAVTIKEYVKATIKPGTNDFYDNVTYLGKGVKQVKFQYSQLLFGNNRFMNEDDEIKKNSSAHIGYQPFANESNVTKLYRYSAPRMGNTIVKDDKYGLSTADLAKRADGKYFTSMTMASGGSLVNLAPVGAYFGKNEAVRYAPYPNASVGSTNDRFPAFTIGGLEISKAGVGSSIGAYNGFYSYLTRKVTNLNTDIIS